MPAAGEEEQQELADHGLRCAPGSVQICDRPVYMVFQISVFVRCLAENLMIRAHSYTAPSTRHQLIDKFLERILPKGLKGTSGISLFCLAAVVPLPPLF